MSLLVIYVKIDLTYISRSVYGIAEIQHGEIVFLIASGPMEIRYRTFTLSTAS